jgi:hypothetical protein
MADAGGGKLKHVPATIANPGHVRARSADFEVRRELREAKEELEAYKLKNGPETRAELDALELRLPVLQAASDKLGAVVRTLGGTVTVDSDVAGDVHKLMMENGVMKLNVDERVKAAETYSETVKRENEILVKYMSELQRAIGDMSFVLNETIDQNISKEEEMEIHRPDASVDDPLTRAGKAFVLEHIAKFEEALAELLIIHTERTQYQKYGKLLGCGSRHVRASVCDYQWGSKSCDTTTEYEMEFR